MKPGLSILSDIRFKIIVEKHIVYLIGNPIDMVNDAWEQRNLVEPISDGMGGTIYNIPYKKMQAMKVDILILVLKWII